MTSIETRLGRARCAVAACACLAVAATLALGAAAPAQAAWSRSINIAKQQGIFLPKVGMDAAGNAVFMWLRNEPDAIYTRSRAANGSLSPIQRVAASRTIVNHDLAVGAQGNAYFVWQALDSSGNHLRARLRYADGTLGPVRTLVSSERAIDEPMVAADASGRAVFTWRVSSRGDSGLIQARSMSASGALSPVQTVARESGRFSDMGVDGHGNATFVWEDATEGSLAEYTRVLGPDGDLGPTKRISRVGEKASPPQVEVTPFGRAVFGWSESDPETGRTTVVARARAANGSFQPVQVLSRLAAGAHTFLFDVAAAPTGEALFCWRANEALHARTRAPGGGLGPAMSIGRTLDSCRAGIDSDGNAVFAWSAFDASKERVFARSADADGRLGPTRALSSSGVNSAFPELALNPAGAAAVVWEAGSRGFAVQGSFGP